MLTRLIIGPLAAAVVAGLARRTRSLTGGGAVAAAFIGTLAVAAGWNWGALLLIYFASSSALSHARRARKERLTASIVAKGGERDAVQVLANGALFAAAAAAMIIRPDTQWIALGAGALAASSADTWATEIGTLSALEPRTVLGFQRVPAGTSGAISPAGTLAMLAGAAFIAIVMSILGWTPAVALCVAIGGVAGATIDTVLGAALQSRRWCDDCGQDTERERHVCGAETRHVRGLCWLDNDLVNFLSGVAGGALAALLSR